MTTGTRKPYPLDNRHQRAGSHHELLSLLFDSFSLSRVTGMMSLRGARCLDVGAGGGGFACLLAGQVGADGRVLAADREPISVPEHPCLSVMTHDFTTKQPFGTEWDLIHARLVLAHLPQRREILGRLVAALRPGGTLLVEDWDASGTDIVLAAPSPEARELYQRFQLTLARIFEAAGTSRAWPRQLHSVFLDEGLADVGTVMHGQSWVGGGPGCTLTRGVVDQLRHRLGETFTDDELERIKALLTDPRLVLASHLLYSTAGRKPASAST